LDFFPCRDFQLSNVTGNDSGRYLFPQRLPISVLVRASRPWWWLACGFGFASWILMFFFAEGAVQVEEDGRSVGYMTKV